MPVAGTRITGLASAAPLAWETNRRVPRGVAAVLAALRFSAPAPELLQQLSDADWKSALAFTDRSGLTLILGAVCRDFLPAWVRERIERDLANNTERIGRLRAALVEVIEQLNARGIEHLLIKGLAQEVDFVSDPYLRVGYDIDLFAPPESLVPARETVESLGYEAAAGTSRFPADHIPPMIRETGWHCPGAHFDSRSISSRAANAVERPVYKLIPVSGGVYHPSQRERRSLGGEAVPREPPRLEAPVRDKRQTTAQPRPGQAECNRSFTPTKTRCGCNS